MTWPTLCGSVLGLVSVDPAEHVTRACPGGRVIVVIAIPSCRLWMARVKGQQDLPVGGR